MRIHRSLTPLAFGALLVGCASPATARDAGPVSDARHAFIAIPDTGTIRVSADASVSVEPDRARLIFAVENQADDAAVAAQANAEMISSAIAAVRENAGEGARVETRGYALRPVYDEIRNPEDARRGIVGFRASNTLVVTLEDLDAVGPTLDAAVGAGANRIDGIQFFAADTRAAYLEALDAAVSNALAEATVIAGAVGRALGEVVEVTSSSGGGPQYEMMATRSMQDASTPIEPGSQSVSASVTVVVRLGSR